MNVGELLAKLVHLDQSLPVVMAQEEQPLGPYSVVDVEVVRMHPDSSLGWGGQESWDWASQHRPEPTDVDVCFLGSEIERPVVIDADVVEPVAAQLFIMCPSGCGNMLNVTHAVCNGDQVVCARCQQVHTITIELPDSGPGWRALLDMHRAAIDAYDRDTRTLATADRAHAELDAATPADGICVVCSRGKRAGTPFCDRCIRVINGGGHR